MKKCSKCGETKPRSEFLLETRTCYKDTGKLRAACKTCHAVSTAEYKARTGKGPRYFKKWRDKNVERERLRSREWAKSNPTKVAARAAARRARKLRATPPWADLEEIALFYEEREHMTHATGVEHHVDHIVPLRHKKVCGLHVTANLQVITAAENLSKSARWPLN